MRDKLITAAIGLVGVAAGAFFQHFLTVQQERTKAIRELRLSAYGKFFEAQAKRQEALAYEVLNEPEKAQKLQAEYMPMIKSASFTLGVYGGREVIKSLAQYYRANAKTVNAKPCNGTREIWLRDAQIYEAMRRETLEDKWEKVDPGDLVLLIFGCVMP